MNDNDKMNQSHQAFAPSNIALIKYMGKSRQAGNIALNPSLSYTLHGLQSCVELELSHSNQDNWEPLVDEPGFHAPKLSEAGQIRFLAHLNLIKSELNCSEYFTVRSANNFPHSAGLASSASSFAALTKAAVMACSAYSETPMPSIQKQAELSQKGSGSSCRSFFEPWAYWDGVDAKTIALPYTHLLHQVILLHDGEKAVSSSEAHKRVSQLSNFNDRIQRAQDRLSALLKAFQAKDWSTAYQISFDEFMDMHDLFHQCSPSFNYMMHKTRDLLNQLQLFWEVDGDGPIITMDAGPNIHLLYRTDQSELAKHQKQYFQEQGLNVI